MSIFISIYTTVVAIIFILLYLMRQNRLGHIFETVHGAHYLLFFCPMTLLVSLFNLNINGVLISVALAAVLVVSLYIRTVMTPTLFETIIDVACLASLYGFLIILLQWLSVADGAAFRAKSTFLNANLYASITEIMILLCAYSLLKCHPGQRRNKVIVILVNLCGLYLSNCRTAILALSVAILALLFFNKRYKVLGAVFGIYLTIAGAIYIMPSLLPRFDNTGVDLVKRISIWQTAFQGIWEHPLFGQGGGTYMQIFSQYGGPKAVHAHSIILDPFLNFGVIGTALVALYFKEHLKPMRQMYFSKQMNSQFCLAAAMMIAVIIHGITDITFFSAQTGLLLAILLSVVGAKERQHFPIPLHLPHSAWTKKKIALSSRGAMRKN